MRRARRVVKRGRILGGESLVIAGRGLAVGSYRKQMHFGGNLASEPRFDGWGVRSIDTSIFDNRRSSVPVRRPQPSEVALDRRLRMGRYAFDQFKSEHAAGVVRVPLPLPVFHSIEETRANCVCGGMRHSPDTVLAQSRSRGLPCLLASNGH